VSRIARIAALLFLAALLQGCLAYEYEHEFWLRVDGSGTVFVTGRPGLWAAFKGLGRPDALEATVTREAARALFERSGATACGAPAAIIQDLGSTFGSSGLRASKVSLSSWAKRPVFLPPPAGTLPARGPVVCRGDLVPSIDAGANQAGEPRISEAGRKFLADLLGSLTDAHIRALFEAGRVDQLGERMEWRDPATKQTYTGIDAWVAAFKHKRAEIAAARCGG